MGRIGFFINLLLTRVSPTLGWTVSCLPLLVHTCIPAHTHSTQRKTQDVFSVWEQEQLEGLPLLFTLMLGKSRRKIYWAAAMRQVTYGAVLPIKCLYAVLLAPD